MPLILRTMKKHMGWEDARDDYVVLDGERSVGRIYKDTTSPRWIWSVNTSPYPAPPPNNGLTPTLEEAKREFKARYEEMKRMGVRPFGEHLRTIEARNAPAGDGEASRFDLGQSAEAASPPRQQASQSC
jgi:hypothetical protein